MAENGTAGVEPKGLFMSLDAIIKEKGPEKRADQAKHRNEGFRNGAHRGRGRRGPSDQGGRGRGRFHGLPQQGWQGPQPGTLPFPPNAQRLVRVDTGAEMGAPGAGPVLLLPPEFLAQGGGAQFGQQMGFGPGAPFGQGMFPAPGRRGPMGQPAAERPKETCFTRVESGEVVVKLKGTEIVRVSAAGDITLDSGGSKRPEVFKALQGALGALGVRLSDLGGDQWSLSDGRSLTRFHDGVVLPSKGALSASRGKVLQAHFKTPGVTSAAAAATAASNAAAAAAGLIPSGPPGAAAGGFNGVPPGFNSPPNGFGMHGSGFNGDWQQGGYANGGNGGRPGSGKTPPNVRRLQAQGRYTPY